VIKLIDRLTAVKNMHTENKKCAVWI